VFDECVYVSVFVRVCVCVCLSSGTSIPSSDRFWLRERLESERMQDTLTLKLALRKRCTDNLLHSWDFQKEMHFSSRIMTA